MATVEWKFGPVVSYLSLRENVPPPCQFYLGLKWCLGFVVRVRSFGVVVLSPDGVRSGRRHRSRGTSGVWSSRGPRSPRFYRCVLDLKSGRGRDRTGGSEIDRRCNRGRWGPRFNRGYPDLRSGRGRLGRGPVGGL